MCTGHFVKNFMFLSRTFNQIALDFYLQYTSSKEAHLQ